MKENSYLYMHYYEDTAKKGYVFSWFYKNCHEKVFYLYVRSDLDVKNIISERLWDYVYTVSSKEEEYLLEDMTDKGKKGYNKRLQDLGFKQGYKLYKIYSTPTFLEVLKEGV